MVTNKSKTKLHIPIISKIGEKRKRLQLLREEEERALRVLRSQQRRNSIFEAKDFVRDFVKERWSEYYDHMRIKCFLAMPELRALGRLPQYEGTKECRKLVSVPVIYDEIGNELWKRLASMSRNTLDEDHSEQEVFERQTVDAYMQGKAQRRRFAGTQLLPKQSDVGAIHTAQQTCQTERSRCIFCGDGSLKHESLPASIREEPYAVSNNHVWSSPEGNHGGCGRTTAEEEERQDRRPSISKSLSEKFNVVVELGTKTISIFSEHLAYGYGYRNVMLERTQAISLDV